MKTKALFGQIYICKSIPLNVEQLLYKDGQHDSSQKNNKTKKSKYT